MSDIFREIDEDLRREQAKKLWDRFAPYVIVAAIIIVVATAGYRGWTYWQETQAQATGDRFLEALELSAAGEHDEAFDVFEAITNDGSGSYPTLARFRLASEKALLDDTEGAIAEFDAIAASNTLPEVATLARLRAALLLADNAQLDDMEERIGDLAATGNTWRHTAREVLGLVAWRTGDFAKAKVYYDDIVADQEAPQDVRQRSQMMLALITAKLGDTAETAAPAPADTPATETPPAAPTPPTP